MDVSRQLSDKLQETLREMLNDGAASGPAVRERPACLGSRRIGTGPGWRWAFGLSGDGDGRDPFVVVSITNKVALVLWGT